MGHGWASDSEQVKDTIKKVIQILYKLNVFFLTFYLSNNLKKRHFPQTNW